MGTGSLAEAQLAREDAEAVDVLIETTDLTNRYQVEWVSEALMQKLCSHVSLDSFEALASIALRHNIELLKTECEDFAKERKLSLKEPEWRQWVESLSPEVRGSIADAVGGATAKHW